ncbi:MAG: hypothetical protein AAB723_01455 [Patescibacteria group bacterium]
MSIFPKIIKKGTDAPIVLHMHVKNDSQNDLSGHIFFTILDPENKKQVIKDRIRVPALGEVDKYYDYHVARDAPIGRYYVKGEFCFGKEKVLSETHKNDYFDVIT